MSQVIQTSDFYPRPPRGGRPYTVEEAKAIIEISIHALREEGDPSTSSVKHSRFISIHALREEGDTAFPASSTITKISIHALREEGDSKNRDKISIFL